MVKKLVLPKWPIPKEGERELVLPAELADELERKSFLDELMTSTVSRKAFGDFKPTSYTSGSASTSSSPAPSLASILAGMEKVKPMSKEVSAAPSWASTSLQWLREKGWTEYLRGGLATSPKVALSSALRLMCYDKAEGELEGESAADYAQRINGLVSRWNMEFHGLMRDFLSTGGYAGAKARLKAEAEGVLILEGATGEEEPIDTQMFTPKPENLFKTPAEREAAEAQELEEALQAELRAEDPRNGSW